MKRFFILFLVLTFLNAVPAFAGSKTGYREADFQKLWCDRQGGQMEVVLKDRTRVDCLLDDYAVEVDFAWKWAEAIGQSLHYARLTGKKPGILLILTSKKDERHLEKLKGHNEFNTKKIKIWTITPDDLAPRQGAMINLPFDVGV